MADALYALEKLAEAVDALVTGDGGVHARLLAAAEALVPIRRDIPAGDLRRDFDEIMSTLTSEPARGDEGAIIATLRTKNADEAGTLRAASSSYRGLDRLLG
jgi:hypothetical protein